MPKMPKMTKIFGILNFRHFHVYLHRCYETNKNKRPFNIKEV